MQVSIFDFLGADDYIACGAYTEPKLPPKKRIIKNLNAGIPYKGSKRKISHLILQEIANREPRARYFWDIFGGGGAMALNAHYNGYKTFYNELDKDVFVYFDFLASQLQNKGGKYGVLPDEYYRFITPAEFKAIKAETTPSAYRSFVLLTYSFGNDWHSYFTNAKKAIFKEKGHSLILDNDLECAQWWDSELESLGSVKGVFEYMHRDIFSQYTSRQWRERRAHFVNICLKLEAIGVAGLAHIYQKASAQTTYETIRDLKGRELVDTINALCPNIPKKIYKGSEKDLKSLQQLEQLERLERLQQLEQLEQLERFNLSFESLEISTPPQETIIYCDPPYNNTSEYKGLGAGNKGFNFEMYYNWCADLAKRGYNVYCSEYNMPADRFSEIWRKETRASFMVRKCELGSGAVNAPKRVERLFIPKGGKGAPNKANL